MVEIEIANLRSLISVDKPSLHGQIDHWMKARQKDWWHNTRARSGKWDGYFHFYDMERNLLPTGLVEILIFHLENRGEKFKITDRRGYPQDPTKGLVVIETPKVRGIKLRDYQADCIKDALKNYLPGGSWWPRGIVSLPTGSGKTEIVAGVCSSLPSLRGVVLVHQKDLLHQTAERLAHRLGEKVGVIGDGIREEHRITVSTVQTLSRNLKEFTESFLKYQQMFLSDEGHHLGAAKTFRQVASCCPAYVRLAFSATPFVPGDKIQQMRLLASTGGFRYHLEPSQLQAQGVISKVVVTMHPVEQPVEVEWSNKNGPPLRVAAKGLRYADAYQKLIVDNPTRNQAIVDYVKHVPGPTLVIVTRLDHGNLLSQELGVPFYWGNHSSSERKQVLRQLGAGRIRAIIASPIFDEGVDAPAIKYLVLACGGKSEVKVMQRIGRGMRVKDDGSHLEVLDFIDGTNPYLLKHSRQRVAVAQKAGYAVRIKDDNESFTIAE